MSQLYSFRKAHRILAVRLNHLGTVLPFALRRNQGGVFEPDPSVHFDEVTLGDHDEIRFDVHVPALEDKDNSAIVSLEFSNWGPRVYQFTSASFLGVTWPFGQEYRSQGPSPKSGHVEVLSYVFKKVTVQRDETTERVWVLSWISLAGVTRFTGSTDVVAEEGGGGSCYVVLRLADNCVGRIQFTRGFGERELSLDPGTGEGGDLDSRT